MRKFICKLMCLLFLLGTEPRKDKPQEQSSLSVSDWVTFLSGEKSRTVDRLSSVIAIVIPSLALVIAFAGFFYDYVYPLMSPLWGLLNFSVFLVCIFFILALVVGRLTGKTDNQKKATEVLDHIMNDDLKTPGDIKEAWFGVKRAGEDTLPAQEARIPHNQP